MVRPEKDATRSSAAPASSSLPDRLGGPAIGPPGRGRLDRSGHLSSITEDSGGQGRAAVRFGAGRVTAPGRHAGETPRTPPGARRSRSARRGRRPGPPRRCRPRHVVLMAELAHHRSRSALVIPPGSGVPVPGACAGSSTSMSTDTYSLSALARASSTAVPHDLLEPALPSLLHGVPHHALSRSSTRRCPAGASSRAVRPGNAFRAPRRTR